MCVGKSGEGGCAYTEYYTPQKNVQDQDLSVNELNFRGRHNLPSYKDLKFPLVTYLPISICLFLKKHGYLKTVA